MYVITRETHIKSYKMLTYKLLSQNEISKFPEIDRSEKVQFSYVYKNTQLEVVPCELNIEGWEEEELVDFMKRLYDLHEKSGFIWGAFEGDRLIGLVSLDSKRFGKNLDFLKLDMLYVSNSHRGKGIGRKLMEISKTKAKALGAGKLYISATPFKNTVDFYLGLGAGLTSELNQKLFDLEPEDVHLEMRV